MELTTVGCTVGGSTNARKSDHVGNDVHGVAWANDVSSRRLAIEGGINERVCECRLRVECR